MDRPYLMDDCRLTLPDGFVDRSAHMLEWRTEEGDRLALVVQREALPGGSSLDDYVASAAKGLAARFIGIHVERDETLDLRGLPLRRRTFRHKHEQEVLYQYHAFVQAGGTVLVFTGAGKARHRDRVDYIVDAALARLEFRDG
jgi:hypothetical protein